MSQESLTIADGSTDTGEVPPPLLIPPTRLGGLYDLTCVYSLLLLGAAMLAGWIAGSLDLVLLLDCVVIPVVALVLTLFQLRHLVMTLLRPGIREGILTAPMDCDRFLRHQFRDALVTPIWGFAAMKLLAGLIVLVAALGFSVGVLPIWLYLQAGVMTFLAVAGLGVAEVFARAADGRLREDQFLVAILFFPPMTAGIAGILSLILCSPLWMACSLPLAWWRWRRALRAYSAGLG